MADADTGVKEWVEGFAREGKPLERITKAQTLQDMQKQIKRDEVELNAKLQKEQAAMSELQNKLNSYNEQYAQQKQQLDELRSEQSVKLDGDQKGRIERLTREAIDMFVARRPRREDEQVTVDVHFLPGAETTGFNLHIGGEGAGSRDAKFMVYLNQQVHTLAVQAAKYWGLDAEKVFFLDRDSRIVPETMLLRDIILPPVQPTGASSSSSSSAAGGAASSDARSFNATSALAIYDSEGVSRGAIEVSKTDDLWTVRGRNYSLTLVRASTVLSKEDLNKPKGEKWQDFTFNEVDLNRELENTRKKQADYDLQVEPVSMDMIPSLYHLIQEGQEKKRRKRADTRCRVAEFIIFLACSLIFYVMLMDNQTKTFALYSVGRGINSDIAAFSPEESATVGVRTFAEVKTAAAYEAWLYGPLQRYLVRADGSVPSRQQNLFVLAAFSNSYSTQAPTTGSCQAPVSADATQLSGNATANASGNASARNRTAANGSNTSSDGKAPVPSASGECLTPEEVNCPSKLVVQLFRDARAEGDQVPQCQARIDSPDLDRFAKSWASGNEFSYIKGKIHAYVAGHSDQLDSTNASMFQASIKGLLPTNGDLGNAAQLVSLFVYSPSLNSLFICQLLVEVTLSGSMLATQTSNMVGLERISGGTHVAHVAMILLAVACFLMELRRILGFPKSLTFEDKRTPCSCGTVLFLLLPVILFAIYIITAVRYSRTAGQLITLDSAGRMDQQSMRNVYRLTQADSYGLTLQIAALGMLNALFFHYLLMYFPQLSFVSEMVEKLVKPLLTALLFLVVAFVVFGAIFFTMFSTSHADFRNIIVTATRMVRFAQGHFSEWYELYEDYSTMFTVIMTVALVIVTVILNYMALAMMLSHKKEKDLFENYSYHPCWASERSKGGRDPKEFNPATIGWDFSGKEPRQVTQ